MKRTRSRKGAPGIVEVAKRAEVSPATVSRAFNSPETVRPETRKRIAEAAGDLGYIRDRMAGAMHNRSSGTVGLIVPTIDNAIFAELIEAFSKELQANDRTMVIGAHNYDLTQEVSIIRSLLERRTDGIALIGLEHDQVSLNMLASRDVPVISIWNYDESSDLPCIGADNVSAGYAVADYVYQQGHRDVAFLFPGVDSNDRARDRMNGALQAAANWNASPASARMISCRYDIGEAKAVTQKLLKTNRPTAIVCGNDIIAHGATFACQAAGIKVPDEMSITGIGDFRSSGHMEPALTTVRLPARRIGVQAAQTIVAMIETGQSPKPFHRKFQSEFLARSSVKAL